MNSLNKVQLIGNLTIDPEVKQTPNGQFVANFNLATNRVWKDSAGQKQEQTEYHAIVVWGKLAEIVQQYLWKGKKVYVEGRLSTRSWEDQTGQKKYKTEIVAESLIMLWWKSDWVHSDVIDDNEDFWNDEKPVKKTSAPKQEQEINIEDIPF